MDVCRSIEMPANSPPAARRNCRTRGKVSVDRDAGEFAAPGDMADNILDRECRSIEMPANSPPLVVWHVIQQAPVVSVDRDAGEFAAHRQW